MASRSTHPSQQRYEEISQEADEVTKAIDFDEGGSLAELSNTRPRRKHLHIILISIIAVATMSLLWLITLSASTLALRNYENHESSWKELDCGNTTTEAKTLGCEFDLLSYTWMPKECIDHKTSAEFEEWVRSPERQFGAWPFFADADGKERILDVDSLSERAGLKTHTTQEEHLGHCTFMLRRLQRSQKGRTTRIALDGIDHIIHCSNEILKGLKGPNPIDIDRLTSIFIISFNACELQTD